jgi:toxin ParE1/3/4
MSRIRISAEASADLDDIWSYIAKDSPANADRFLDRILRTATTLSERPRAGRMRDELGLGLRSFPVGNYHHLLPHR